MRSALIFCGILLTTFSGVPADEFNYDESKVPQFALPELLVCSDGTKVTTADEWVQKRRPEILHLFEEHVFGQIPDAIPQLRTRVRSDYSDCVDGKARRREITVFFTDDDSGPQMDMMIYTPVNAKGPVPAFLGLNFQGNHTIEADPRIHVTESWVRGNSVGAVNNRATADGRGAASSRWALPMILDAGFGLVTIYYGDIDPDFDDGFRNGIHSILEKDPEHRPADAGGSISAWAWGLSRALDVLETDPLIDGGKVAVFGHSRLGKTSLWAGASDQRFAMVISNDSGCGGAALSRRRFGETVARINTSFPHWFCLRHRDYNNHEDALPVDHHMLIALAAPRPVYVASAEEDRWADPRGEFLSLFHASPVYELFGKKGLASDQFPAVNSPLLSDVGYHVRTGKHDVTDFDWQQYLRLAQSHLR
ncbi:MAG: acetylxylan esterase [Planctomycetaceae bacterium]|nr:acetylxylan esterase [Planctomycetaceae bacterium]